jgi:hypothetical protein
MGDEETEKIIDDNSDNTSIESIVVYEDDHCLCECIILFS